MNLSILKQNNLENALFLRVYTVPFPPKAIFYSSKSHFWIFEWYHLPTFYFGLFFFLFYIKQLSIFQCLQLFFNTGYLNKTFFKKKRPRFNKYSRYLPLTNFTHVFFSFTATQYVLLCVCEMSVLWFLSKNI